MKPVWNETSKTLQLIVESPEEGLELRRVVICHVDDGRGAFRLSEVDERTADESSPYEIHGIKFTYDPSLV